MNYRVREGWNPLLVLAGGTCKLQNTLCPLWGKCDLVHSSLSDWTFMKRKENKGNKREWWSGLGWQDDGNLVWSRQAGSNFHVKFCSFSSTLVVLFPSVYKPLILLTELVQSDTFSDSYLVWEMSSYPQINHVALKYLPESGLSSHPLQLPFLCLPFYIFNSQQAFAEIFCLQLQMPKDMIHFITGFQGDLGGLSLKCYL